MLNENHISGSKAVVFFSSKFVLGIPTNKVCQLISSKWRHDLGSSKLKPHHDRTSTWMCPAILIAAFQLLAEALDLPRVTWEKMGASSQNWGGQIFTSRAHFPLPLVYISQPLPQYIGNWLCLHTCDTHGNINSHHLSQMCKLMCTVHCTWWEAPGVSPILVSLCFSCRVPESLPLPRSLCLEVRKSWTVTAIKEFYLSKRDN